MSYLILIIALLASANVCYRMIVCTFKDKNDDLTFTMIMTMFVWIVWLASTWSGL